MIQFVTVINLNGYCPHISLVQKSKQTITYSGNSMETSWKHHAKHGLPTTHRDHSLLIKVINNYFPLFRSCGCLVGSERNYSEFKQNYLFKERFWEIPLFNQHQKHR